MSKVLLVGTNHAGVAFANTLLDNYPGDELVMVDRNSNLSYLSCGTALWIGRQIADYHQLFYAQASDFTEKGAKLFLETEVESIDFEQKIAYLTKADGSHWRESYDQLVLATGSVPISPNIPGRELDNIQSLKFFQDGQNLDHVLENPTIKEVAVIGAGYIGVEIAEAAKRRGKNVRLFDAANTCLANYYDPDFSKDMDQVLQNNGIETHYGELVQEYKGNNGKVESVVTNVGEYPADAVLMAIGFAPNAQLGKNQLQLFDNGAYLVNEYQQTSLPDVYAIGDCATIYSNALQKTTYIALASNAIRTGIVAGHSIGGKPIPSIGAQGSNGISIFDYHMVSTGLSVTSAEKQGLDVTYTEIKDEQRPKFMQDNNLVKLRIVYEKSSRRIVGAQMASYEDISMGIHMFSLAINEKFTIDKLQLLDLFFLPHFNQPYNYITKAAIQAD